MIVYGPYLRKDGRKHVIMIENGIRTTQSYPRYLMEKHLGRKLLPFEEVDHIDHDFTNDAIENLQVLTKSKNHRKELDRLKRQIKFSKHNCPMCKTEFVKMLKYVKHNRNLGKAGPFCSRQCAGKYRK